MTTKNNQYDIVVIGAGPVGLSFAASLEKSGLKLLLIEKASQSALQNPNPDGREIALTHLSKDIFKELGCWNYLLKNGVSKIKQAKVFDGDSPYHIDFKTKENEALGYLTPNYQIRKCLYETVSKNHNNYFTYETSAVNIKTSENSVSVTLENGKIITAKLAIAADSRFSKMRAKMGIGTEQNDFARHAIVCRFSHKKPHNNTAFECFHYGRTLAILPMNGQTSSAVITIPNNLLNELMTMSPEDFATDVEQRLHSKLGEMKLEGERYSYPLVAVHAKQFVKQRFALLGDASVGMHPVTAHGFNLGLRGQRHLSQSILKAVANQQDIGSQYILKRYETKHQQITRPIYHGTNGIVSFFTNDTRFVKIARKAVMRLANNFKPLKSIIVASLTETKRMPKLPKPPKLPSFTNVVKLLKPPFVK